MCRNILCHEPRLLQNGQCITNYRMTKSNCFATFVKMTPLQRSKELLDNVTHYFGTKVEDVYSEKIPEYKEITEEFELFAATDTHRAIVYLVVHIMFNTNAESKIGSTFESLLLLDKITVTINLLDEEKATVKLEINVYNITDEDEETVVYVPNEINGTVDKLRPLYIHRSAVAKCSKTETIPYSRLHACPYIVLELSEISVSTNNDLLYINDGNIGENIILKKWEYEIHGPNLHICLDAFRKVYNHVLGPSQQTSEPVQTIAHVKQIVSFFCMCLSVLCLFITITAYLRFPALHTQPGINNVLLCIFLLAAQTTYQFGAGQRSLSDWACSLVGGISHFLWLTVMFSMNICSIHMFKVFKNSTEACRKFHWSSTWKYFCYIVGTSLTCVGVNLSISFATSTGKESGYGGNICYISSGLMQILTFILPAAAAITVNIILFSYVVFKIKHSSLSTAEMTVERSYFSIYARLSTLTGCTWTFGFLNLFLKIELLEYIFIILNASQGVFIMIAFVLNKRIYTLCCKTAQHISTGQLGKQH